MVRPGRTGYRDETNITARSWITFTSSYDLILYPGSLIFGFKLMTILLSSVSTSVYLPSSILRLGTHSDHGPSHLYFCYGSYIGAMYCPIFYTYSLILSTSNLNFPIIYRLSSMFVFFTSLILFPL